MSEKSMLHWTDHKLLFVYLRARIRKVCVALDRAQTIICLVTCKDHGIITTHEELNNVMSLGVVGVFNSHSMVNVGPFQMDFFPKQRNEITFPYLAILAGDILGGGSL